MIKEIKIEKFEGLAYLLPDWYVNASIYMGYLIVTVHDKMNFLSPSVIEDYYKLQNALSNHNPDKDFKEVIIKLPDGEFKKLGASFELSDEHLALILPDTFHKRRFSHFQDILTIQAGPNGKWLILKKL